MNRILAVFTLIALPLPPIATAQAAYPYYPYPYDYSYGYSYPYTSSYPYPSGSCTYLAGDLSYGSRSPDVLTLQQFLVNQGYPGTGSWMLTGYFGNATHAALILFQASRGLPQTGIADAVTRAAITQAACLPGQGGYSYNQYQYGYPYNYYQPYYPYQPYQPYPCTYPWDNCHVGAAPSITGVTGPTLLQIGMQGTWSLNLQSYGNQYVTTSVRWGDEYLYGYHATPTSYPRVSQTLTFTHTYTERGTYTVVFTVRDPQGRENTSSITVSVY